MDVQALRGSKRRGTADQQLPSPEATDMDNDINVAILTLAEDSMSSLHSPEEQSEAGDDCRSLLEQELEWASASPPPFRGKMARDIRREGSIPDQLADASVIAHHHSPQLLQSLSSAEE